MASKRFEIDIGLNASGVAKGASDGKKALADLEAAVGDVADESARSGGKVDSFAQKLVEASRKAGKSDDDIKDALRGMGLSARQAERAVEGVGDELRDTGRQGERSLDDLEESLRDVQRQSKKTEESVDDIGGKGFRKMSDGAKEVTQEVGQNLGEAVSSIRGDLSDLGQVGQDTLGGLAATLAGSGPAGIAGAAGLAAGAVGLGLITAEIEKQNERVQALKEYFAAAWQEAVDGGREYIDVSTVIGEMNSIMFDPDRAEEYKRIQEDANKLGLDRQTLLRAAAGDQDALNLVIAHSNELVQEHGKKMDEAYTLGSDATAETLEDLDLEGQRLLDLNGRWEEYGRINDENRQKAADSAAFTSAYLKDLVADADDAAVSVDALGNKMIELPDGQTVYIDAETGQATLNLETFEGDADGVIDHVNGRKIVLQATGSEAIRAARNAVNIISGMSATIDVHADVGRAIAAAQAAVSRITSITKWD